MFPRGKTKCAYFINYCIAPHLKSILVNEINASPFYSLYFDESMNRILQSEQMDLQIRYWDNEACISKTPYLDSQFVLRPNAENLFASLNNGTECLQDEKMIQLSMDGPSTNWLALSELQEDRGEKEDLGSCGLHVISGTFQTS